MDCLDKVALPSGGASLLWESSKPTDFEPFSFQNVSFLRKDSAGENNVENLPLNY